MTTLLPPRSGRALAAAILLAAALATYRTTGRSAAVRRDMPPIEAAAAGLAGWAAVQPGVVDVRLTPIADTTLDRVRPSVPLGGEPTLELGRQLAPDDDTRVVLLRFGLPELDAGSQVVTATLTMTRLGGIGQASVAAGLGSLSEPFDERTVTWSSRPDIARVGGAAYVPSAPGQQRLDVAWAVEEAIRAQRHLGLQLEVPAGGCDAGRSRTFASRESPSGGPELHLAYVGPGTPHPFPSPTPTRTPTRTPTPTGTRPPTPTPTPTSNRPQPRPPEVFEPAPGAVLSPPEGVDAWVVRWRQSAPTLCSYHIVLHGPGGDVFATDLQGTHATCFTFTTGLSGAPSSLADGTYAWHLYSHCPPFNPQQADSPSFELRASNRPSATATAAGTATDVPDATITPVPTTDRGTATATATARPIATETAAPAYLPWAGRGDG